MIDKPYFTDVFQIIRKRLFLFKNMHESHEILVWGVIEYSISIYFIYILINVLESHTHSFIFDLFYGFFENEDNNDISSVDIIIFNKTICVIKIRITMDQTDLILNLLLGKYTINSQCSELEVEKIINTCNSFREVAVEIRYSSINKLCIFNPFQ